MDEGVVESGQQVDHSESVLGGVVVSLGWSVIGNLLFLHDDDFFRGLFEC